MTDKQVRVAALLLVLLIVMATLVYITVILARTYGHYEKTDEWIMFWTAATPVLGLATLVVLAAAVYYAKGQVDITRESARVTLTDGVLNSTWLTTGLEFLDNYVKIQGPTWHQVRGRVEWLIVQRPPSEEDAAELASLQKAMVPYIYLSRLYRRGVLDQELTIESAAYAMTQATYILEPMVRNLINAGGLEDEIFSLARACILRFKKRPEMLVFFPILRDWSV
jgi:hypothetical protein